MDGAWVSERDRSMGRTTTMMKFWDEIIVAIVVGCYAWLCGWFVDGWIDGWTLSNLFIEKSRKVVSLLLKHTQSEIRFRMRKRQLASLSRSVTDTYFCSFCFSISAVLLKWSSRLYDVLVQLLRPTVYRMCANSLSVPVSMVDRMNGYSFIYPRVGWRWGGFD